MPKIIATLIVLLASTTATAATPWNELTDQQRAIVNANRLAARYHFAVRHGTTPSLKLQQAAFRQLDAAGLIERYVSNCSPTRYRLLQPPQYAKPKREPSYYPEPPQISPGDLASVGPR